MLKSIVLKSDMKTSNFLNKWDKRFLDLAEHVAGWSKDPSTKCGAVITKNKKIISQGFNGFPQGVPDKEEWLSDRTTKYSMVLHAEVNAILFAKQDLTDCSIYVWPMPPCPRCAAQIIQSGIKTVISMEPSEDLKGRWGSEIEIAEVMFKEAGVDVLYF